MDSLLITPTMLQCYNACHSGVDFIQRFYPDGFTIDDVYNKKVKHIPIDFAMWAYHRLPLTEEDKEKFKEYYGIKDSQSFFQCHHITNCEVIAESSYCVNSRRVEKSRDIYDSSDIYNSKTITSSTDIHYSIRVSDSCSVWNSLDVAKGLGVYSSSKVRNVFASIMCENVCDSYLVEKCTNGGHLFLTINLSDQKNRIACTEQLPDEYAIFNKGVTEQEFTRKFQQLETLFIEEIDNKIVAQEGKIATIPLFIKSFYNEEPFWHSVLDILSPDKKEQLLFYQITAQLILLKI